MRPDPASPTRDQVLFHLKTRGSQTAAALAERLELTTEGVRQHLAQLEAEELVEFEEQRGAVGRPARTWRLTPAGDRRFPEGYAELAVDLIQSVKQAFGAEGMDRLVQARTQVQETQYRAELPPAGEPLAKRVAALARIRTREGYMAEWRRKADGSLLLVENHCPICAAAQVCQGICGAELELFQGLLGKEVKVERTEHILEGARRCAYRIEPLGS